MNTKKYISDAFIELIKEKPFDKITVKDIIEYSQISRSTFYNHFSDKYDIIRWYCDDQSHKILERTLENANEQSWYSLFYQFNKFTAKNRFFFKMIYLRDDSLTYVSSHFEYMYHQLKTLYLTKTGQENLTKEQHIQLLFIVKGTQATIKEWVLKDLPYSYQEISDICYNMIPESFRKWL